MKLSSIGKIAGAIALTATLAGCFDITMDVSILSETGGKATVTTVMAADVYAMLKGESGSNDFCKEEGAVLTENADGSATCVQTSEGTFAELDLEGEDGATFTVVEPGVVRAAFSTAEMQGDLASTTGATEQDEQTKAMMTMMFEGKTLTLRIGGKKVTDTNMTLSADGTSAEQVIPLLDLMNGTAELPPELYVVVDTR
jgi:hypothetical protein